MERHGKGHGGIGARDREVRRAGHSVRREERRWRESGGGGGGEIDMVRWGMRRRGGWVWLGV
jgi:hypothetical protein